MLLGCLLLSGELQGRPAGGRRGGDEIERRRPPHQSNKIILRMSQEDDYCPSNVSAPILTGFPLRAFASLAAAETLFAPVRNVLIRKNGFDACLNGQVAPDEEPMFAPDFTNGGWRQERNGFTHLQTLPTDKGTPPDLAAACGAAAACCGSEVGISNESFFGDSDDEQLEKGRCDTLRYHSAYLRKRVTPSMVAERLIDAVKAVNAGNPPMHFFISWNEDLILREAQLSTQRYAIGEPLSIFDGVPFAVKDEIDVENFPSSAGTAFMGQKRATRGTHPAAHAFTSLGAIFLGKTSMHEVGIGTTGINPACGTARNPHDARRITGGSSSGSAALVAAGLAPFAHGADGGGSIRIPAALCGIVGLKPTHGRVCPVPGPTLAPSVGVHGVLASTVADCLLAYAMMANRGHEKHHVLPVPPSLSLPDISPRTLSAPQPLKGLIAGIPRMWFEHAVPEVVRACYRAVDVLQEAGAKIVDIKVPHMRAIMAAHTMTISSEMRANLMPYISDAACYRKLTAETRISLATAAGFTASQYIAAQKIRRLADTTFRAILSECDVIVTPTVPVLASIIPAAACNGGISDLGTTTRLMRFVQVANFVGLPAISVPVGMAAPHDVKYENNNPSELPPRLPIGLQILGSPWHEATLIHIAACLEHGLRKEGIDVGRRPAVHWDLLDPSQ